tara:strand:+ start:873 stop:1613 length:741 start_codon:yes stop_codon:yes gene_type:complete
MAKFTWNDENTNQLQELAGDTTDGQISQARLTEISDELGTTARSVGSKLRKMGYDVQKASEIRSSAWNDAEEAELVTFLENNSGEYTYAEIASAVAGSKFNAKQVQGKVLSLELTSAVKPTERVAPARKYSEEQEATFIEMANAGASMEDIADKLGVSINSARGKALSLYKSDKIPMPTQTKSNAQAKKDVLEGLDVAEMTVEDLVEATGHSARGIRSMLSRRGVTCADYDGAAKRAKLDAAKDAE